MNRYHAETLTQVTATLAILGGDADVDQYLQNTRSNVQDLEAARGAAEGACRPGEVR